MINALTFFVWVLGRNELLGSVTDGCLGRKCGATNSETKARQKHTKDGKNKKGFIMGRRMKNEALFMIDSFSDFGIIQSDDLYTWDIKVRLLQIRF